MLLWNLTISTSRSKLKSHKNPNQFKMAHNITQADPGNQDKITTNNKTFLLLYPNKSWQKRLDSWLENNSTVKDEIKNAYLTHKTLLDISLKTDSETSILA